MKVTLLSIPDVLLIDPSDNIHGEPFLTNKNWDFLKGMSDFIISFFS
jgi:hypothetical protein